ncbi:peptide chain release factor N(5)-glutamine methyltransferase [Geminocystis sp. NIES-3709]|uniref:peptide chain release factor N(5)-glutamine methyltransferase n=1 Tax=Geminocystis sp. NIES-3709 TaxID=1617448 RepID=UPI0005FC5188|nr:peptide chain release factor N(5)-glutamine methyltransferase [Geminocystis sp. NIES-3709]BAQ66288.1 protein-N(5)-glutamine methyltransferase PrmC [Geminocystis sp. NIES-3709]
MFFSLSGQKLFNWYQQAKQQTIINNIPLFELDYLLIELTNLNNLNLRLNNYQNNDQIISKKSLEELQNLWDLRVKKRCPVQYLIGECHWRNFTLKVTPDVLIPRPETELIIDRALQLTEQYPYLRSGKWLDLGTGSGAIAIALADTFPEAVIYAVDKSEKALKIAQENAFNLGFFKRIKFFHGSWFNPINELKNGFSGIVSNPPYIPSQVVLQLQPEVINHEPRIALDGGDDGLNDIRHLIINAPNFLINNGVFILEMMDGQGDFVEKFLINNTNYTNIKIDRDLANLERFALAYHRKKVIA